MTEEVIESLPEILKRHICTLRKASYDDKNQEYMCDSGMKVINFDKIPNEYARGRGWRGVPSSNDALYISAENKWYFVEFKNGEVKKEQIYRKLYDSLIMLIECGIIPDFEFLRENVYYILVYNSNKNEKIPESTERDMNYSYIFQRAEQENRLFGIEKFEKYLFNETHTYTKELFEKDFIIPRNREENEENC